MAYRPISASKLFTGVRPIVAVVMLLLASLALMSNATQGSARFGELYSLLLIINVMGLLSLATLIAWHLYRLLRQVAQRRPGARLTVRMVGVFVVLAVTPVVVVYYFSLQFLHRGIDSWFDVRIEQALEDAMELSRTSLEVRMREVLKKSELLAADLSTLDEQQIAMRLEDSRRLNGATELSVLGSNGRIIASSNVDPTSIVPTPPGESILQQLRQTGNYIGLDPIGVSGLHVRVMVSIAAEVPTTEPKVLQGLFPVTERMSVLADGVESAYGKYRELAYLRNPLKISFTLTLSLILLLSVLTAVLAAFFSARRLVAPLSDLAQGTQAVAAGDYETQLPRSTSEDEVGFLVESFNKMTRELARARDETRKSQRELEDQRTYLGAVLDRLSTGVLTLDHEGRLYTSNAAAEQILDVSLAQCIGKNLAELATEYEHLTPLVEVLEHYLNNLEAAPRDWREEIALTGTAARQVLTLSAVQLPGSETAIAGQVIVFDDITALIQAQRDAAWSEVARRLAHEIKNPLTPIQLSAERLRHKYLGKLEPTGDRTLDRLTLTIVQQVEAMKSMVNAFSDYARSPGMVLETLDLNELLTDVVELYRAGDWPAGKGTPGTLGGPLAPRSPDAGLTLVTHLAPDLPSIEADKDRLRQIFHNLLKNALEASEDGQPQRVELRTRLVSPTRNESPAEPWVELRVRDWGRGFPENMVDHVFEPYVTTKNKGSGLGLAIVKKIAEEHGGTVTARNNDEGGASIFVRLPLTTTLRKSPPGAASGDGGSRPGHRWERRAG